MKQLLLVFLIGFVVLQAQGQPSLDVGVFGGAGTYFGDMTHVNLSKSIHPAYGAFTRYNFNPRYGLRFNVLTGSIGAEGKFDTQTNPALTDWNFKKNVLDVSLQFEWNFFKYIVGDKTTPNTTYIFGGVGMHTYSYENPVIQGGNNAEISPTIPFGLGFKFNVSKRVGIGFEGGLRKTFSDKLDNLDDPLSYQNTKGEAIVYSDQYHNNDWTSYVGIHLVYKMIYGYKQWELKSRKDRIIDWGIENNPKNR